MVRHLTMIVFTTAMTLCLALASSAEPARARIEQYGTVTTSGGAETPEFVVTLGEPLFFPERAGLATLVGVYQANAVHWVHRTDDTWVRVEYRAPLTPVDYTSDGLRIETLQVTKPAAAAELPPLLRGLAPALLANIRSTLDFYSGALRIYLRDESEAAARRLADALNARP